jgi:hypothetical protein
VIREEIDFSEAPFCAIAKSTVCEGQGLFALKKFEQGDIISDYNISSNKWTECNFDNIPKEHKEACWWVGKTTEICLLALPESLFMRANHSNEPNTDWFPEQKLLKARVSIQPGEEITFNYTKEIAPISIKSNVPSWI